MTTDKKDQNEMQDSLPEAARERLRELAAKLENERNSLNEAQLMREAEVTSLQTELKKRGEAWDTEKKELIKTVSILKADKAALLKEREKCAVQQETLASLEAELSKRGEAWNTEKNKLIESFSLLKADQEALNKEREKCAAQQDTIASLEAELSKRGEAWNTEKNQHKTNLDHVREELREERKQRSDM
ncbi:MAG: hypothetical protein Q7R35_15940, partial [Elusimicrobiota bacterium]|nr:hypothetical protein [Elusimicrobiota bacterium]